MVVSRSAEHKIATYEATVKIDAHLHTAPLMMPKSGPRQCGSEVVQCQGQKLHARSKVRIETGTKGSRHECNQQRQQLESSLQDRRKPLRYGERGEAKAAEGRIISGVWEAIATRCACLAIIENARDSHRATFMRIRKHIGPECRQVSGRCEASQIAEVDSRVT